MNNLEKIIAAFAMGWAAQLKFKNLNLIVVSLNEKDVYCSIYLRDGEGRIIPSSGEVINNLKNRVKIAGYLYMGQLGGNEPIPEGQRFRVKGEDNILISYEDDGDRLWVEYEGEDEREAAIDFNKSEIEPVIN